MSICLIHLSDIHFRGADDPVVGRVGAIKRAVLSVYPHPEACFVVVSGDVANTGSPQEYDVALSFFQALRESFEEAGISQIEFVTVPGNHDLSLSEEVDTRQYVLDSIEKFISKPIDLTGLTYDAVISVQGNFFQFDASLRRSLPVPYPERLYYHRTYQVGSHSVAFHCFNTAWLSRRHEVQAKLYLPPQLFVEAIETPDLSVALFHHPYNWLSADNHHTFKAYVEGRVDLALTGHEHVAGATRQLDLDGRGLDYLEGGALRDPINADSSFQVLLVDFDSTHQVLRQYRWTDDLYAEASTTNWTLTRNNRRPRSPFVNTPDFIKDLHAIGVGFHHPRCMPPHCQLELRQLFVYPSLRHQNVDYMLAEDGEPSKTVSGENLVRFIQEHKKVVIYGADDSGKTALAKILYDDLRTDELLPLLINGEALKSRFRPGQIDNIISDTIRVQYSDGNAEKIRQLEPSRRLLILDDFDKARLTKANQESVIGYLTSFFGSTVIIASDLMQLQDIARSSDASPLRGYEFCTIKEFGKFHRHRLIHKWLHLGREDEREFESLGKDVLDKDKTISTLLGKNVLPHFPVTILTLLQLLEGREAPNTANGSYGYLYEVLIKSALARVGHGASDVDAKITYLSGFGFTLFTGHRSYLTEDEFRLAHDAYCERYDMSRDFSKMAADLINSDVLTERNGEYRFKYPYIFYYSVAKYLHENVGRLRETLHDIADHIYNDLNANILIFYVYLTKDQDLIARLVASATVIFGEQSPCDMEANVALFNEMYKLKAPPLELTCGDASQNRDLHNLRQDEAAEYSEVESEEADERRVKYADDLEDIIRIQIGFRTLQILGQVLRNFTGSLPGDLKLLITNECYALGLRLLNFIFSYSEHDVEGARQYIGGLVAERTGISDKVELATRTDLAIIWLNCMGAFGCIKRVSYAVGHSDLSKTYSRVLSKNRTLATEMIDATIKLDHFARAPESELKDILARTQHNPFAAHVMRDLVAEYLYLYNHDAKTMQLLGSMWNIKVSTPKMLAGSAKR